MLKPDMAALKTISTHVTAMVMATILAVAPVIACQEEAMLVFDASGSMSMAKGGLPKIDIARAAAADVLPELTSKRPTGLVTYGGERGQGCRGVSLKLPPMAGSGDLIIGELSGLQPSGSTPLTEAVWTAALTLKDSGKPGTIVVVTDGKENCGYNACHFSRQLALGAKNIKVHVIGFYMHTSAETNVACLAKNTGGTYTSVHGLDQLKDALKKTLACPRIS
ncbi:MAG: Ca-activated chloride channel family protein [Alphaproteobacteria bacterium]|jgi:Ca-activated chloride channel family protein